MPIEITAASTKSRSPPAPRSHRRSCCARSVYHAATSTRASRHFGPTIPGLPRTLLAGSRVHVVGQGLVLLIRRRKLALERSRGPTAQDRDLFACGVQLRADLVELGLRVGLILEALF